MLNIFRECGLNIAEDVSINKAVFEYSPDEYENTNLDFYIELSNDRHISFEVKYTEPDFGTISIADKTPDRYANSWKRNYSRLIRNCPYFPSDLFCDKNCSCTKGGILNDCCDKAETCKIYEFYNQFQISRNILYANSYDDIVVFLTPRENFFLNSGRKYIDQFAIQHNTQNIVNLYWEDVSEKVVSLTTDYEELNKYMNDFKNKYFSRPSSLPTDILTEKGFINYFEKFAKDNISTFYKNPVVNFRGKTEDTNRCFTEVISQWLVENIELLGKIEKIDRTNGYKTAGHDGIIANYSSGRNEEIIAKQMFNQKKFDIVGEILDYQTPLKATLKDEAGKVDLLGYDGETVYVLELKHPNSKETMLRCALEGYTYMQTIKYPQNMFDDFELTEAKRIITCPLVALDGAQHDEMKEDRPYLKQLMKILDIEPVYYKEKERGYVFLKD